MDILENLLRERRAIQERLDRRESLIKNALKQGAQYDVAPSTGSADASRRGGVDPVADFNKLLGDANRLILDIEALEQQEKSIRSRVEAIKTDQATIKRRNLVFFAAIIIIIIISVAIVFGSSLKGVR